MEKLSHAELATVKPGEVITLTTVLALMAVGILAVVTFKLFMSNKGSTKLPGGWSFDWVT